VVLFRRFGSFAILARRALVGTTGAYVVACLVFGGSSAARPSFFAMTVLWCAALLSWSWWHGRTGEPERPSDLRRGLRVIEVIGVNLALTLILAESLLRAFASFTGSSWVVSNALDAYRLTPGRDYGGGLHGNSLGYPGRDFDPHKSAGVYRIAALGDSFAVGPTVPFADNYLTLLASGFGPNGAQRQGSNAYVENGPQAQTEVYNFGVSGVGPREYCLILRRHVWNFQPDLVLVSIFVGNDITETLATPRHMDPSQHATYILASRAGRLLAEYWRRHWEGGKGQGSGVSKVERCGGTLSEKTFREVEARRLAVCLKSPPASLEKKWQSALAYLERLIKECRSRNVPVAFVLIPDEFQVNPGVLELAFRENSLARDAVDLDLPRRRLRQFFAERQVPCLDLLPDFDGVPDTYTPHDTHWNVRGNRLAAERVGEWLNASFRVVAANSLK
jgi:hypothetical protein